MLKQRFWLNPNYCLLMGEQVAFVCDSDAVTVAAPFGVYVADECAEDPNRIHCELPR